MLPLAQASLLHFILETLGVFLAIRYYYYLRQRTVDPVSSSHRLWIIIAATVGALLGSRLLGSLENPPRFWSGGGDTGWLYYWQSKTILGGLLGGLWAVEGTKRWLGEQQRSGDLFVYPLLLAMVVGRIGCFLMGVHEPTYGLPTDVPWGLDLGDGIRRHATALYEIFFLLVLAFGLRQIQSRNRLHNGQLFMLFMTAYLLYRWAIGYWQPRVILAADMGTLQWAALIGLLYYAREWWQERHSTVIAAVR